MRVLILGFCIFASAAAMLQAQSASGDTCMMCHGKKGSRLPYIEKEVLGNSAHGRFSCISCHREAGSIPHPKTLAPVSCALCHGSQAKIYLDTRHGIIAKGNRTEAEACGDCHGSGHGILGPEREKSPVFRSNIAVTCARCHADSDRMAVFQLAEMVPVDSYRQTVHGLAFEQGNLSAATCTDCHSSHGLFNSRDPRSTVFRKNIPETCGSCHSLIAGKFRESVHGRAALDGIAESPVCTDCHESHAVSYPGESGAGSSIEEVTGICTGCHESEQLVRKFNLPVDRLSSYRESYHGMAARRGDTRVANCASCHGYHDILPSEDPRSSVNPENLAETCGSCHPGAGEKLASAKIHGSPESKHWTLAVAHRFYWIIIPLALVMMLIHNCLDWIRKVRTGARTRVHTDDVRFTVNERLQHFILFAVFILLALSGFALKYPDAAWAQYLSPNGEAVRRSLHRWAALTFSFLAVYHCAYMVFTVRGRRLLREMLPRRADMKDMLAVAAFNLGISRSAPVYTGFYRYHEKIEYWALVWGAGVMMISGALLVFDNFTLRYFPLWVSDLAALIHYLEAILACLAIAIWHFYGVIFDPDVYPMNCAWLNGRVRCSGQPGPAEARRFPRKIPYGRY